MTAVVAGHTAEPVRRFSTVLIAIVFGVVFLDIPAFVYTQNDSILPRHWFAAIVAATALPIAWLPARDVFQADGIPVRAHALAAVHAGAAGNEQAGERDESFHDGPDYPAADGSGQRN